MIFFSVVEVCSLLSSKITKSVQLVLMLDRMLQSDDAVLKA